MATRSRIGIKLSDGSVLSSYHHWDGYPEWLGRILKTHYNSKNEASELIDGGDMSCAWTKSRWNEEGDVDTYGAQYYSQRGDQCPPRLDKDIEEFFSDGEEYGYIFENGEWKCYDTKHWSDTYKEQVSIPTGALAV